MTREEIAKMELEALERDLKAVEDSYGENMLNLAPGTGLCKKSAGQRQGRQVSQRDSCRPLGGIRILGFSRRCVIRMLQ